MIHLPVAALIAAYGVRFSLLSVTVYNGYGSPAFDLSVPDQGIWLLSRFHDPFVTIMGRNLFADHTSFIFVLLVPLYWIYPHVAALLVTQALALAAGAIPVYLLARRLLGGWALPTAAAAAYLLNPALQWGNLEQVHVEAFLVVLIGTAIYAAVESRPRLLAVAVVGCLLCKEDAAVLIIPLGIWVALRRNRKWGLRVIAAALVAVAGTELFILAVLGTITQHGGRLPFGGPGGILRVAWERPGQLWRYLRQDQRPFYLWQLALSTGFSFLRAPEIALIGIGTLGINEIVSYSYMHEIRYHYTLPLVAVLALASVWAISRMATRHRRQVAAGFTVGCAFAGCLLWGLAPFSRHAFPHANPQSAEVQAIGDVERHIPPRAVVSASYVVASHLAHRTQIYQWPTPFAARYWGTLHEEGQRLGVADQVTYVMISNTDARPDAPVWASIRQSFRLVISEGGFSLFQRVSGPP